jgi:hypothetical protein
MYHQIIEFAIFAHGEIVEHEQHVTIPQNVELVFYASENEVCYADIDPQLIQQMRKTRTSSDLSYSSSRPCKDYYIHFENNSEDGIFKVVQKPSSDVPNFISLSTFEPGAVFSLNDMCNSIFEYVKSIPNLSISTKIKIYCIFCRGESEIFTEDAGHAATYDGSTDLDGYGWDPNSEKNGVDFDLTDLTDGLLEDNYSPHHAPINYSPHHESFSPHHENFSPQHYSPHHAATNYSPHHTPSYSQDEIYLDDDMDFSWGGRKNKRTRKYKKYKKVKKSKKNQKKIKKKSKNLER